MNHQLLLGIIGLPCLLYGASLMVKHGISIARHLGISEFFVGLTILSIGTSIPEIFTHIVASIKILLTPENIHTLSSIAIGTDLGSNIVQITFIVGIVALFGTLTTNIRFMHQDYLFMLLSILILWFFSLTGNTVSRLEGGILVAAYMGYLTYLAKQEELDEKYHNGHNYYSPVHSLTIMSGGLIVVLVSAQLTLESAVFAAEYFNISGSLIGAVIIGVATALPELTTAMMGLKQKSSGISAGTLIGSNITNPMLGIGAGAVISTYTVDTEIMMIDLPFWFIVSVIGWVFFRTKLKVEKGEAIIFIAAYFVYLYIRLT
jgi:cation:H+ antiporter